MHFQNFDCLRPRALRRLCKILQRCLAVTDVGVLFATGIEHRNGQADAQLLITRPVPSNRTAWARSRYEANHRANLSSAATAEMVFINAPHLFYVMSYAIWPPESQYGG